MRYSVTSADGNIQATHFLLSPELSLPKPPTVAGAELQWSRTHAPLVFWAIQRSHEEDKWNCQLVPTPCHLVLVANMSETVNHTASADVPSIVNVRTIMKGDEVVLQCAPPPPPKQQKRIMTWQSDHAAKVRKGAAKLGSAGSSAPRP